MTIPTCEIQPMNKMMRTLSASMEVLFFCYGYAAVVAICQDSVDESSSWNSD